MNQTEHFQLSQWDAEDRIQRTDFNADNAKLEEALADHAAALAGCGNCRIYTASYVGTGAYGAENPNRLTFPWNPSMVLIIAATGRVLQLVQGCSKALVPLNGTEWTCEVTWGEKSVSWYCSRDVMAQMNDVYQHWVVAISAA